MDTPNTTGGTNNPDAPAQAEPLLTEDPAAAPAVPETPKEGTPPEETPEESVPEKYEDFTAPEGIALDPEVTGEFKELAKELKLPQAKAQKVADLGVKLAAKWQSDQQNAMATTIAGWAEETRADKELGGEKLGENLAVAKRALDTFGSPELKKLLNESGLGNHPELIRMLHKAGKTISEDKFVGGKGGGQTGSEKPIHERMYPDNT
jgi:hypothetical protein